VWGRVNMHLNDADADTRNFLKNTIGCYIEVNIRNNIPDISFHLNQESLNDCALSDNARCFTHFTATGITIETDIWKAIEEMCDQYSAENTTFFINIGDFPIIMKDRSKHPQYDRYTGNGYNAYPKNLSKVFSRSIIETEHDDILFPTRDFIDVVYNRDSLIKKSRCDYTNKKPVAVFRGSITGNDRTINNIRVQAKILSLKYPSYFNYDLVNTYKLYIFEPGVGFVHTLIDDKRIYDDAKSDWIDMYDLFDYKYILHIDGFVAAWRMTFEMFSMSVILKVDSPWVEHYYKHLKPWVHFIPIKSDLSNLISTIEWCRDNDDVCHTIAKNAYQFAIENFTKENLFGYLQSVIYGKPEPVYVDNSAIICIPNIKPTNTQPEVDIHFNNVNYKRYICNNYNSILLKRIERCGIVDKITNSCAYTKFKNRMHKRVNRDIWCGVSDKRFNEDLSYCFGNLNLNIFITNDKINNYYCAFSKFTVKALLEMDALNNGNLCFMLFLKDTNLEISNYTYQHIYQYKKGSYYIYDKQSTIEIMDDHCEVLLVSISLIDLYSVPI
jgi:Glycosyl transferase family 90